MVKKYNKAVALPKLNKELLFEGFTRLWFSRHVLEDVARDYKHDYDITKLSLEDVKNGEIVKIETEPYEDGELLTKVVVRVNFHHEDYVLVLIPHKYDPEKLFVKTIWINDKHDTHKTLNTRGIQRDIMEYLYYW